MRVYWPTTLAALARLADAGELAAAPVTAHAVTPTLRDYYADADPRDLEEELEYVAMTDAAGESVRLLAAEAEGAAPRRVVLALDVPDAAVQVGARGLGRARALAGAPHRPVDAGRPRERPRRRR